MKVLIFKSIGCSFIFVIVCTLVCSLDPAEQVLNVDADNDTDDTDFLGRRNLPNEYVDLGEDEERLVMDLFRDYNNLIRPVPNARSPPVVVDFGVAMILLINVDEKNQILQTNVWLTMRWHDFQLRWNPEDYGNITSLHVPSDRVWLPDIVLFNNADGNYEVSFRSNAFLEATGHVTWVPPAMFKSSCQINVEWFPFDQQTCNLIFGSWTYNSDEVVLNWYNNIQAVQLTDYSVSGIWDVIDVPGKLFQRDEKSNGSRILFEIIIRRKTLFYTVILIIPTVLMAFLSMMTFYLPADSAEKISLTINLLLALVVFLLLVSKILPPTSSIPLMGQYLLMAFVLNIVTVVVTVIIVNIYFRSAKSHVMSDWVRTVFLEFLPRVLVMRRPERIPIFNGYFIEEYCASEIIDASSSLSDEDDGLVMPSMTATIVPFLQMNKLVAKKKEENSEEHHQNCHKWKKQLSKKFSVRRKKPTENSTSQARGIEEESNVDDNENTEAAENERISREMKTTVEAIAYIAEHMKSEMNDKKVSDDWKYVAMVIDRLLLLAFFGITLGGTMGIILSAPHVFEFIDQEEIIKRLNLKYMNVTGF